MDFLWRVVLGTNGTRRGRVHDVGAESSSLSPRSQSPSGVVVVATDERSPPLQVAPRLSPAAPAAPPLVTQVSEYPPQREETIAHLDSEEEMQRIEEIEEILSLKSPNQLAVSGKEFTDCISVSPSRPASFTQHNLGSSVPHADELYLECMSFSGGETPQRADAKSPEGCVVHTVPASLSEQDILAEKSDGVHEQQPTLHAAAAPVPLAADIASVPFAEAVPAVSRLYGDFGGFTLAFEDVCLPARTLPCRKAENVIDGIAGYFDKKSVCAVVCNDSEISRKMLLVLSGIEQRATGSVMGNNLPVVSTAFRRHVAYISSIDVCIPDMTVRDSLLFSARMRMVASNLDNIVLFAAEVVDAVELLDVKVDYLSTAQLYRVAIAMELVMDPSVVFLENPMKYHKFTDIIPFANMLGSLTKRMGCSVVLSGDNLPPPVYACTQSLLLLDNRGRMLYSGTRRGMEGFFQSKLFFPDVQGDGLGDVLTMLEAKQDDVENVVKRFHESAMHERVMNLVALHRRAVASNGFSVIAQRALDKPTVAYQLLLLLLYTTRRSFSLSNIQNAIWVGLVLVFVMVALMFKEDDTSQTDVFNKRGMVFLLLSCAMLGNLIFIDAEIREFFLFFHLRNNNYFYTWQHFLATLFRLSLPRLLFSVCGAFVTIFVFRHALPLIILFGQTSLACGTITIVIVSWYPDARTVLIIENAYYMYAIIMSGFLVCLPTVPAFLPYLSILRYSYGGVISKEFRGREYSCNVSSYEYCLTGDEYLESQGFKHDNWGGAAGVLVVSTIILLLLAFVGMHVTDASRRG